MPLTDEEKTELEEELTEVDAQIKKAIRSKEYSTGGDRVVRQELRELRKLRTSLRRRLGKDKNVYKLV